MADEKEKKSEAVLPPPETRVIGLFQEIDESKTEEIIYGLKLYQIESNQDIEFYISSILY
jgi:ATP-dependent protease ClpP protease subunit